MLWIARERSYWTYLAISLLLGCTVGPIQAIEVPAPVLEAQQRRIEVIRKISASTVAVFGLDDGAGGGSAVVISPNGYALTNFHVTKPVGDHLKCGMNDGVFYDAVIVGVDPTGDVAVIKMLGRDDFPAAELGDSDLVQAGDWCIVSGNPFLLATDFHPTITYGIVSGVHRYQYPSGTLLEYADCIQTDASINPGNSGGPLWNARGQLIGINGRGSFEKRGRVNVGVGYAISINQIKNFMGYLKSGRIVDHATLGATVATDDDGRVIVTNILEASDAYRRGLRYGDQILSFAGRSISSTNAFKNVLGTLPKGWRVPITFMRGEQEFQTRVRLAGVHRSEELIAKLQLGGIAPPPPNRPRDNPERDPESEQDDEDQLPRPRPHGPSSGQPKPKQLDEKVAKFFQKRHGFANYFFNEQKQESIWNRLDKPLAANVSDPWRLVGKVNGKPCELLLTDALVRGRVNGVFEEVDFTRELSDQLAPRSSGGLLLALHQWRRFVTKGPETFGEVYYLGSAPSYPPGETAPQMSDVLVATFDVLESRLYFDPDTGQLTLLELYPDIDVDPCELHFTAYDAEGGVARPSSIQVLHGDELYGTVTIDELSIAVLGGEE